MRSTFISFILLSSVVTLLVAQQAGAIETRDIAERSQQQEDVVDGHLRLLTKRSTEQKATLKKKHRKHHSKNGKRSTCSSGGSSGTSSVAADSVQASYSNATTVAASSGGNGHRGSSTASAYVSGSTGGSSSSSGSSKSGDSSSSSSTGDSSSSDTSSSSGSGTSASSLGSVTGFQGTNTGIGSWFQTNSGRDDTDGTSWCQLKYQDSWMGFAPSVQTMLDNFGGVTNTAGKAYCGREAKATNPNNGKTALIYIVDGFASEWVKTPGSVDLTVAAFTALYGSFDNNKDTVIQNLQWEFTGNVNSAYEFNA